MLTLGLVVKLTAKPGREDDLGSLLRDSLPLAVEEAGTPVWLAVRTDPSTFWIVDAHAAEADRQAHLDGRVAAGLMARADELLAEPPEIMPSTILGAKPAA